uniref:WAP domain-containing protein n=1 Tax=Anas platyrhynchos TaxID=8839 RepID=A0A8B9QT46_ANAPL
HYTAFGLVIAGTMYIFCLAVSSVFASRPGICPMENMETSDYPCTFDAECPGLKKCCNSSKGEGCVDPKPEGMLLINSRLLLIEMCLFFPSEGGSGQNNNCYHSSS